MDGSNCIKFVVNVYLAILCDLFGMVKWPLQWLSDLQLGDKKVTLNHLEYIFLFMFTLLLLPGKSGQKLVDVLPFSILINVDTYISTHRIHVWYIYLHLVGFYGKCRWIDIPYMDPMGYFKNVDTYISMIPCWFNSWPFFFIPDHWMSSTSTFEFQSRFHSPLPGPKKNCQVIYVSFPCIGSHGTFLYIFTENLQNSPPSFVP